MYNSKDSFRIQESLPIQGNAFTFYSLPRLAETLHFSLASIPYSIRVLLENVARLEDGRRVTAEDVRALADWSPQNAGKREVSFMPSRVLLQDFTGVPVVADLAALRDAAREWGLDPERINPQCAVDLVIDHSVQVDVYGTSDAILKNTQLEYARNRERYSFLKWGQQALRNFRAIPPEMGIVHQVNLEHLAEVVSVTARPLDKVLHFDTVIGTDSHTTMINGLGVLGWGVGGIEAEAAMLGQPQVLLIPEVVGVRLTGTLQPGVTATDAVLTLTQMLRKKNVVGKFVEFFGPGLDVLSLPDRATLANMAPEYGATMGYFPIDAETLAYLRLTGRPQEVLERVEAYAKAQQVFREPSSPEPLYSELLEVPLSSIEPCLAGPKRPQDLVSLKTAKAAFLKSLTAPIPERGFAVTQDEVTRHQTITLDGQKVELKHGTVVLAAITSCTNTSNPSVMLGAGLLAQKAVARGLKVSPQVKTSLAPGSRVVTDYLEAAGLTPALNQLGFHLVGYGCTTCIGNSGPLPEAVAQAIQEGKLVACSVLSGNRNFEGRVNPHVRANYLASPALVVAYALAGRMDLDLTTEPLGVGSDGKPVYLKEIWPSTAEIKACQDKALRRDLFVASYATVDKGDSTWSALAAPQGNLYAWDSASTYIRRPPFFENLPRQPEAATDIRESRVLALLGDSVTTDHISPAGSIAEKSPAGIYLMSLGVGKKDFNSYGARRGNHEVMMRGTFANVRLKNRLTPQVEGGVTRHLPSGDIMSIYDAAMLYKSAGIPLIILAGKEYGSGSSRDWAAKGPALLGVKAVVAESFERIHRSNLVGMGVWPLEFLPGQTAETLGLTGEEFFDIQGPITEPRQRLAIKARRKDGRSIDFQVIARVDTAVDLDNLRQGGLLPAVLRELAKGEHPK